MSEQSGNCSLITVNSEFRILIVRAFPQSAYSALCGDARPPFKGWAQSNVGESDDSHQNPDCDFGRALHWVGYGRPRSGNRHSVGYRCSHDDEHRRTRRLLRSPDRYPGRQEGVCPVQIGRHWLPNARRVKRKDERGPASHLRVVSGLCYIFSPYP